MKVSEAVETAGRGGPMVKRRCPYEDERKGRWMNVSALAQFTADLDGFVSGIEAFRSHLERPATWEGVSATLWAQMVGPAVHLLTAGPRPAPIPVRDAVGYKLAAGYTTPVREILQEQARGETVPVTLEALDQRVRGRRPLVGAREVCAAPTPTLDRVTGLRGIHLRVPRLRERVRLAQRGVRGALELDRAAPVSLARGFFPTPRCLRWLELMMGHWLRRAEETAEALVLRSQEETVPLAETLPI